MIQVHHPDRLRKSRVFPYAVLFSSKPAEPIQRNYPKRQGISKNVAQGRKNTYLSQQPSHSHWSRMDGLAMIEMRGKVA
jgi:hypothetical protein